MKKIIDFQKNFDKEHGWDWNNLSGNEKIEKLKYAIIALTGEMGEIADPVKKYLRKYEGKYNKKGFENLKQEITEELVDVMIYLIKFADLLDIDLEESYFDKMKTNKKKFKDFEI